MRKILILTGELAFDSVKRFTENIRDEVEIYKLPISIAAFISPEIIKKALKDIDLSKYEFVLCPGLMKGNLKSLGLELKQKIFKGPRYSCDIPISIKKPELLSPEKAADKMFLERELQELERMTQKKIDEKSFQIGTSEKAVYVGVHSYPIILAEIVDAPKFDLKKNIEKARYYVSQGADIIDVGAIVGQDNSRKLKEIIESLKQDPIIGKVPISIDSLNPAEIESGVESGADLVLSLDAGNAEELSNIDKNIGVVALPTNVKEGFMPRKIEERVKQLSQNIETIKNMGFEKILADPLLEAPISPGLFNSLNGYNLFRKIDSETPLMFGIGNVVELIDADGLGINAIFACLAFELKVSAFLTTEYSLKTRGTVNELSQSIKLAYLASKRQMVPKDLPITLFKAKSKTDIQYEPSLEKVKIIEVGKESEDYKPDSKGFFRIWINHEKSKIFVAHYKEENIINIGFSGRSAESIGKKILAENLISSNAHAFYLGRELEKAEICLELGKSYIQDIRFGDN